VIDDLEQLEETFGATLKLALHHAAEAADVEPPEEDFFVAVLVEPVVRRPRRLLVFAAVAAVLLAAIAGTIVFVHVRRSMPATHEAVEIAPGWALSREGPIGIRTGGVFLWDGSGAVRCCGAARRMTRRVTSSLPTTTEPSTTRPRTLGRSSTVPRLPGAGWPKQCGPGRAS
jgi:hypothetical protein